jgi:hypothetical protein
MSSSTVETSMDEKAFERELREAELLLERIHIEVWKNRVRTADEFQIRKRVHEGLERARAELARTRNDIWPCESDLPF